MAKKYWIGGAAAVAQVVTIQITVNDAATTYTVTIGGLAVSVAGNAGGVNSTASDLQAALAASTDPRFTAVTWTVATDTVTGTAAVAGVPFVAASSVSGGTGTIGAVTTTTASAGPSDWSTAGNWSDAAVPASTDDVTLSDTADNIVYGLAQSSVTLARLTIEKSYTGKLGLRPGEFATSADGATVVTTAREYRDQYLHIGADLIEVGANVGPTSQIGSARVKIHQAKAGASTTEVIDTASAGESPAPAVLLLASNAAADVVVRSASGGVGLAMGEPTETATFGAISVNDVSGGSRVFVGDGATIGSWSQIGGAHTLNAAATVPSVTLDGGTLTTEGDYTITALTVNAGTVNANHIKTGGNAITTATIEGGTLDGSRSGATRTWATVNANAGTLKGEGVTITTLNPPSGLYSLTVI